MLTVAPPRIPGTFVEGGNFDSLSAVSQRLVAHTLDTCDLDPAATPLEIEVWKKAARWAFDTYGVSSRVICAVTAMAPHISGCSDEE